MQPDEDMSSWTDLLDSSTKLPEQAAPSAQFPPLQRNLDQLEALSKKLKAKTLRTEAPTQSIAATRSSRPSLHHQSGDTLPPPTLSIEQLPDASLLLNSPSLPSLNVSGGDHYSRVAAAMAENPSCKREANGSIAPYPCSKQPRGNLRHSRLVPDTVGSQPVAPQLNGRSNVVTEDMSKLFVNRRTEYSH